MRRVMLGLLVVLLGLGLFGCGGSRSASTAPDPDALSEQIDAAVSGVSGVTATEGVRYMRSSLNNPSVTGVLHSDSSDADELKRILDDAHRALLPLVEGGANGTVHFVVLGADGTRVDAHDVGFPGEMPSFTALAEHYA